MADERRVLILDDDPLVGLLVETVARLAGAATQLTTTHAEFHTACQAWSPTHIVLDLTLPGFTGEQVLAELAALGCRARIVVSSGADTVRMGEAVALGRELQLDIAGALPKPFAPAALRVLLA
ncbi:MAG: response regulator [Rubrivivax sp.]|nr:response regulator [Rubrivivax sp.]